MADRSEDIVRQRLLKLDKIRARNVDPYPHRYRRTHTLQEAATLFQRWEAGEVATLPEVKVAGRLVAHRPMGKATFLDIRDGSGKIQLYLREDHLGEESYDFVKELDVGDIIGPIISTYLYDIYRFKNFKVGGVTFPGYGIPFFVNSILGITTILVLLALVKEPERRDF